MGGRTGVWHVVLLLDYCRGKPGFLLYAQVNKQMFHEGTDSPASLPAGQGESGLLIPRQGQPLDIITTLNGSIEDRGAF